MRQISFWKCWVLCCIPMSIVSIVRLASITTNPNSSSSFNVGSLNTATDVVVLGDFPLILHGKNYPISSRDASPFSLKDKWKVKLRDDETYTGYRYVQNLIWNVPKKVSWSANENLYKSWKVLPVPPLNHTVKNSERNYVAKMFQYAIIRDPLERLYSGYYNKCIKSPSYEDHCIFFPPTSRGKKSPTLLQFLYRNYRTNNFRDMLSNDHYRPISLMFPNLDQMDHVFHMDSPNFNRGMSSFWKRLGANHSEVDRHFPTNVNRKLNSYHSGITSSTIQQHYPNCTTLQLAMIISKWDYEGPFSQPYFPTPVWALQKLQECQSQGITLPPPPTPREQKEQLKLHQPYQAKTRRKPRDKKATREQRIRVKIKDKEALGEQYDKKIKKTLQLEISETTTETTKGMGHGQDENEDIRAISIQNKNDLKYEHIPPQNTAQRNDPNGLLFFISLFEVWHLY
jgi:hypothetical protein